MSFSNNIWYNIHLHFSRGLHPEAKYLTRSSFVSFCATTGATVEGAAAITGLSL